MLPEPFPPCIHDCAAGVSQLYFEIPATAESIVPVVDSVLELVKLKAAESSKKQFEIGLALQEALANAIVHGCNRDSTLTVKCWVAWDHDHGFSIGIRDPGKGFDLGSEPQPLLEENLTFDHGRGIHLIRELMDEVHFERNGAEIHMRKR